MRPAWAGDLLPFKRGICVETTTPCKDASNASIVSYRGGRGGLAEEECTIRDVHSRGDDYRMRQKSGFRGVHVSILKGTILFNPAKGDYDPADLYPVVRPDDGRAPDRPGARRSE